MAHTLQERYSNLVLAKMRDVQVLKDGLIFNNDYEGDPKAGAVKVPVRDTEVAVSAYNKATGLAGATGTTTYKTINITKDVAVNEIIDGYDAQAVPDNLTADRLDSAGYSMGEEVDGEGAKTLIADGTETLLDTGLTKDTIYEAIVDVRTAMTKAKVPSEGRYLLVTADTFGLICKSPEFISASSLGDSVKQAGVVGRIAGFNVIEWNGSKEKTSGGKTYTLNMIAGHPRFATRIKEFSVPVHIQDLSASGTFIGASAVQGRMVYDHAVLRPTAIRVIYSNKA